MCACVQCFREPIPSLCVWCRCVAVGCRRKGSASDFASEERPRTFLSQQKTPCWLPDLHDTDQLAPNGHTSSWRSWLFTPTVEPLCVRPFLPFLGFLAHSHTLSLSAHRRRDFKTCFSVFLTQSGRLLYRWLRSRRWDLIRSSIQIRFRYIRCRPLILYKCLCPLASFFCERSYVTLDQATNKPSRWSCSSITGPIVVERLP